MKNFVTFMLLVLFTVFLLLISGCDPNEPTVNDVGDFHIGYLTTTDEDAYLNFTVDFWVDLDFSALEGNEFYVLFDTERDPFDDGIDYYAKCRSDVVYVYRGYPYDGVADVYKGGVTPAISSVTDGKRYEFKFHKSLLEPIYNPDYTIHYWFESKTGTSTEEYDRLPNTGYLELDYTTVIY